MNLSEYMASADDNKFWRLCGGEQLNLLDEAIEEIERLRDENFKRHGLLLKMSKIKASAEKLRVAVIYQLVVLGLVSSKLHRDIASSEKFYSKETWEFELLEAYKEYEQARAALKGGGE